MGRYYVARAVAPPVTAAVPPGAWYLGRIDQADAPPTPGQQPAPRVRHFALATTVRVPPRRRCTALPAVGTFLLAASHLDRTSLVLTEVVAANFQAALLGFGGAGCNADGQPEEAGRGNRLFFNPWSSAFAARLGEPLFNAPELRRFIIGDYLGEGESRLATLEGHVTGFLPGYRRGFAMGMQYRRQSLDYSYDPVTRGTDSPFSSAIRTSPPRTTCTRCTGSCGCPWASAWK